MNSSHPNLIKGVRANSSPTILAFVAITALLLAAITLPVAEAGKSILNYYFLLGNEKAEEKTSFEPGDTIYVWLKGFYSGQTLILTFHVYNPNGLEVAVYTERVSLSSSQSGYYQVWKWKIPSNAPAGKWYVTIDVKDLTTGREAQDSLPFNVAAASLPQPVPTTTSSGLLQGRSLLIVVVGGIAVVAAIGAVIAVALTRRKPGEIPQPPQQPYTAPGTPSPMPSTRPVGGPSPSQASPQSGETIVIGSTPQEAPTTPGVGGETMVVTARLVAPNGQVIPITGMRQAFGREDFVNIVPPETLRMISRRSRPQFEIYFDMSKKKWYIVDNYSANGTYVNGTNIKGMGPVELKSGDVINPGGAVDLRFEEV